MAFYGDRHTERLRGSYENWAEDEMRCTRHRKNLGQLGLRAVCLEQVRFLIGTTS